jgi:hypothetical protein
LAIESTSRPFDLNLPLDRSRTALNLDLTFQRSTTRPRDGRITLDGLARDGHVETHQAIPNTAAINRFFRLIIWAPFLSTPGSSKLDFIHPILFLR